MASRCSATSGVTDWAYLRRDGTRIGHALELGTIDRLQPMNCSPLSDRRRPCARAARSSRLADVLVPEVRMGRDEPTEQIGACRRAQIDHGHTSLA